MFYKVYNVILCNLQWRNPLCILLILGNITPYSPRDITGRGTRSRFYGGFCRQISPANEGSWRNFGINPRLKLISSMKCSAIFSIKTLPTPSMKSHTP